MKTVKQKAISIFLAIIFLAAPLAAFAAGIGFTFSIGSGGGMGGGAWDPGMLAGTGLPTGSLIGIIEGILGWLLTFLGIAGVIGFLISGILYLISTGDETMIERAKSAMKWSIVGIIVGLLGVVVIQAVNLLLNGYSNF